jgi:hypothetical protein
MIQFIENGLPNGPNVAKLCATIICVEFGFWGGGGGEIGKPLCSTYYRHKMHTFEKKEAMSN